MKKIPLTKNRINALYTAISLDDILYEKYRRLMEDINRRAEKYLHRPKKLWKVIQEKDGNYYSLQVTKVEIDGEGSVVYVR